MCLPQLPATTLLLYGILKREIENKRIGVGIHLQARGSGDIREVTPIAPQSPLKAQGLVAPGRHPWTHRRSQWKLACCLRSSIPARKPSPAHPDRAPHRRAVRPTLFRQSRKESFPKLKDLSFQIPSPHRDTSYLRAAGPKGESFTLQRTHACTHMNTCTRRNLHGFTNGGRKTIATLGLYSS